jgi:hypothetical protein
MTNLIHWVLFWQNKTKCYMNYVMLCDNKIHNSLKFLITLEKLVKHNKTMKKRCFAIDLATQFLICNDHLQLIVFLHYEWYQTSFMSCKRCNSPYRWCISLKFNYNFVETTHFQLLCNSITIIVTMSCWCY